MIDHDGVFWLLVCIYKYHLIDVDIRGRMNKTVDMVYCPFTQSIRFDVFPAERCHVTPLERSIDACLCVNGGASTINICQRSFQKIQRLASILTRHNYKRPYYVDI